MNVDSLLYHMPRISHWIQQGWPEHFGTAIYRRGLCTSRAVLCPAHGRAQWKLQCRWLEWCVCWDCLPCTWSIGSPRRGTTDCSQTGRRMESTGHRGVIRRINPHGHSSGHQHADRLRNHRLADHHNLFRAHQYQTLTIVVGKGCLAWDSP